MNYLYYFIMIILSLVLLLFIYNMFKRKIMRKASLFLLIVVIVGWIYPVIPKQVPIGPKEDINFYLTSDIMEKQYQLNESEKKEMFRLLEENMMRKTSDRVKFDNKDDVTISIFSDENTWHIYLTNDPDEEVNFIIKNTFYNLSKPSIIRDYIYSIISNI